MKLHSATVTRHLHSHQFIDFDRTSEQKTLWVTLLTGVMMVVEIIAGYATGSMALLADGWHMGTHAFALGISFMAYFFARKYKNSQKFSFGTGKFGVLAGYTSSLLLGATALWIIYESIVRMVNPVHIAFNEAIMVATLGLAINLISVFILHRSEDHHNVNHEHEHEHSDSHDNLRHKTGHTHHDHNYRAAYFHVIADSLTSIFAMLALVCGRFLGLTFLDPLMGILGGVLICHWAYTLIISTGSILLDTSTSKLFKEQIISIIESDSESCVADLHVWHVSSKDLAIIVSIVTGTKKTSDEYSSRLQTIPNLAHISIEVHHCTDNNCRCAAAL